MITTIKVRIYPNNEQINHLFQHFGSTRYIYNRLLKLKCYTYKKYGKTLSKFDLKKRITVLKKRKNTEWLKNINSQSLQEEVYNKMDKAFKNFFNGSGFPKFKSKNNSRQSFNIPQNIKTTKSKNFITIPKIGTMKMKGYRKDIQGDIKSSTLYFQGGNFYLSLTIHNNEKITKISNNLTIGIDVNSSNFLTESEGKVFPSLNFDKDYLKLHKIQKLLSRKKKGSNNRRKVKLRLNKQHLKISNKRLDYLHKIANHYSDYNHVVVEDLNIKKMTKSNKGDIENPGTNVKKKSEQNKNNLQQGWGIFFDILNYKLQRKGNTLTKVNPAYTSQTCHCCGYQSEKNRENQSIFVCKNCGHSTNADLNAAKNIKYLLNNPLETLHRTYRIINACGKSMINIEEQEILKVSIPL